MRYTAPTGAAVFPPRVPALHRGAAPCQVCGAAHQLVREDEQEAAEGGRGYQRLPASARHAVRGAVCDDQSHGESNCTTIYPRIIIPRPA